MAGPQMQRKLSKPGDGSLYAPKAATLWDREPVWMCVAWPRPSRGWALPLGAFWLTYRVCPVPLAWIPTLRQRPVLLLQPRPDALQ